MSSELDRLVAACLFPGFEGVAPPDWLLRRIEGGLGGVVLFARNIESPEQVRALTSGLRAGSDSLVVATDEEGGDVTRLESRRGSSYPGNWALGVVDDLDLTEDVATAIGADLAAVGVNLDLAPVADVNSNPENPVIGIRAFGSEPELVSRHVAAFVRGIQRRHVAACAKHFPGHGDTSQDSHLELPVGEPSLEPFRAAIAAGVRTVMTAHVRVPSLAAEQATLSPRILTGLLRDELGFDGVAMTDALEMRAVSETVGVEEGAVRALAAGADALCLGADVDDAFTGRVHTAVVDAVRTGRLAEARLAEAAARVRELAAWAVPDATEATRRVGAEAARRALIVDGDPVLGRPPIVLDLRPAASIAAGEPEHGLGDLLDAPATVLRKGEGRRRDFDGRQPVVVVRDAHRHEWERALVERWIADAPDTVVVELGVPLWRPASARGYLATHGGGRANLEAAASALSGSGSPTGR